MRSTLAVLAALAASCGGAYAVGLPEKEPSPEISCAWGVGMGSGNLLGQAGVLIKAPTVSPWGDCQHNLYGVYASGFGFFTTEGAWRSELDGFVGLRKVFGNVDIDARLGEYHVNTGTAHIEILNARFTVGYTHAWNALLKTRVYGAVDEEYATHGFGSALPNVVDFALGFKTSYKLNTKTSLFAGMEFWKPGPGMKGFFENSNPNGKVFIGAEYEFAKNNFVTVVGTAMKENNFDHTDHSTKTLIQVGWKHVH